MDKLKNIFDLSSENMTVDDFYAHMKNLDNTTFFCHLEYIKEQDNQFYIEVILDIVYEYIIRKDDYQEVALYLLNNNSKIYFINDVYERFRNSKFITEFLAVDFRNTISDRDKILKYYELIFTNEIVENVLKNNILLHISGKDIDNQSILSSIFKNLTMGNNVLLEYDAVIETNYNIICYLINNFPEFYNVFNIFIVNYINYNESACKLFNIIKETEDIDFKNKISYSQPESLINIFGILYNLWINSEKIINISNLNEDLNFYTDEKLNSNPISLDIDNTPKNSCNLFFLVHRIIHIGIIPNFEKLFQNKKIIADYEFLLKEVRTEISQKRLWDGLGKMKEHYIDLLNQKLLILYDYSKECKKIINHPTIIKSILNIYDKTCNWIVELYNTNNTNIIQNIPSFIIDNILDYVLEIYNNRHLPSDNCEIYHNLIDMCIKIMNDFTNISNPYLKTKCSKFLSFILVDQEFKSLLDIEICKKELIPILVKIFINIENTGSDNQFYQKFEPRYNITYLIRYLVNSQMNMDYNSVLIELSEQNDITYKRLIMHNLNDTNYLFEELSDFVKNIRLITRTTSESYNRYLSLIKSDYIFLLEQLDFLLTCSKYIPKIIISKEILTKFILMANNYLNLFTDQNYLSTLNKDLINMSLKLSNKLIKVYQELIFSENTIEIVANDTRSYHKELFKNIIETLNDYLNKSDIEQITSFDKLVNEYINNKSEEVEKTIPEDIRDPIMFTLIQDPVILPSSNILMDKSVIITHLLSDQTDPFNRDFLDIDKLNEYNNQEEVIEKLELIKEKIKKYQSNIN